MSRYNATLTATNTNAYLFTVHKPRNGSDACTFTVGAYGTFGGGTLAVNISPDNGVTLLPLAPINGASPSITAAGAYTFKCGNGDKNGDAPKIYVSTTGGTTPTLQLVAWDNN